VGIRPHLDPGALVADRLFASLLVMVLRYHGVTRRQEEATLSGCVPTRTMPVEELYEFLASQDDAVTWRNATALRTRNGLIYIQSCQGRELRGDSWQPRHTWHRL
jgi:hypothetical protein